MPKRTTIRASQKRSIWSARGDDLSLRTLATGDQPGACWTTLAIALHALVAIDDYEQGVSWAIALGGDADTNAAVAGALLGCRHGEQAIPPRWLDRLSDRERIEQAAGALLEMTAQDTQDNRA